MVVQDDLCVQQINDYLRSKCPTGKKAAIEDLLSDAKSSGVGIIIREHMLNLPPPLLPMMHESLCNDIDWARENAEDDLEAKDANFEHLIILAPLSYSEEVPTRPKSGVNSEKKQKKASIKMFDRFDDEILVEASSWGFEFTANSSNGPKSFYAAILSMKSYRRCIGSIRALVGH